MRLSKTLTPDMLNTSHLQSLTKDIKLSWIPPSKLCPICFAEGSKTVFVCFDGNFQLIMLRTRLEKWEGISPQDLKDKRIFDEKESTICTETSETDCSPMKNQEKQIKHQGHVEISRHLPILPPNQGTRIQVCLLQSVQGTGFVLAHIIFPGGWANDSSNRNCYLKRLWLILCVPRSWYGQWLHKRLR